MDGKSVKSCTVFAVQAEGAAVTTIEGMAAPDGTLHALQEGFAEMHGLQCGFCTPGMIMRAHRLLQENPAPSEAEIRDRKSVGEGKSVSGRVDLGGRRISKKKTITKKKLWERQK